jgi:hypothetical protein
MFNTTTSTKMYVPIELRAKTYAYGCKSPRTRRFVTRVRQLVHHDGGKDLDTKPACLAAMDRCKSCASNDRRPGFSESPTLEDIIAKNKSK